MVIMLFCLVASEWPSVFKAVRKLTDRVDEASISKNAD